MEPQTSLEFFSERKNTAMVIILTIVFVVILIAIFIIAINLTSRRVNGERCTAPSNPPENILVQQVSSDAFTLSWDSIPNISLYTIYIGLTPGFTRTQSIQIETTDRNFIGISGLTTDNLYYIILTANNACGESDNSAEIAFNLVQV